MEKWKHPERILEAQWLFMRKKGISQTYLKKDFQRNRLEYLNIESIERE